MHRYLEDLELEHCHIATLHCPKQVTRLSYTQGVERRVYLLMD